MTDAQPRQDSASHREAEFSAFYKKNIAALGRFGRTLTHCHHDAEDMAAEAMKVLFEKWDDIQEGQRLTFAFKIVHNKHVSMVRRAVTQRNFAKSSNQRQETDLDYCFELLATSEAIRKLSPQQRYIIRLNVEGLSNANIATVLNIEKTSVAEELSRARSKLRRLMGRHAVQSHKGRKGTTIERGSPA
ncbi:RNA polymerase sigma factor [Amycolatopsis sp. NPDC003861]